MKNIIYLVYDGECLLCSQCAKALKIKKAVGELEIINARFEHPLVEEVKKRGYDLNEGLIVKYENEFYYGPDAVSLLALLSGPYDFFNRVNALLFKSKTITKIVYPILKIIRNFILKLRHVPKINMAESKVIFQDVFGENWHQMPVVFQKRYGNHLYQNEKVLLQGIMQVSLSKYMMLIQPLLRITRSLVPYAGKNIPATVELKTLANKPYIYMNRTFYYPNKKPYSFNSRIEVTPGKEVIEFMSFGFGVKMHYRYDNNKVILKHIAYIWRLFGINIPLPLSLFLGKVTAEEKALSESSFRTFITMNHFLAGKIFSYEGIIELIDPQKSLNKQYFRG